MKLTWFRVAALTSVAAFGLLWFSKLPATPVPIESTAYAPRYPIVLVHGMMGFDALNFGWFGKQPYWRHIDTALRAQGAKVYVTRVSAFNTSEVRGEQLLKQVEQIRRESGVDKVNLIGHSHGSQTSRYVAGKHPDWVASVTSVAGPNGGSEFADWMQQQGKADTWMAASILAMGRGMGQLINWATDSDLPQDPAGALASLHSEGAAAFSSNFPAGMPKAACEQGAAVVDGVRYFSWSGVGVFHNWANPAEYLMSLSGMAFKKEVHDGLVGRCASHLGQVIRDDYPMNHFQAVNQLFGLVGDGADPIATYVEHAKRLHDAGL